MTTEQPSNSPSSDPLASLHRMSTTAGVASAEYVAINLTAVIALVLGLASVLAFFSNVLLVVPAAGIIFGLAALRQVSNSNGTQTGRALAALGVLVSVGVLGVYGYQGYQERAAEKAEEQAINTQVAALESALKSGAYDKAFELFSPQFKQMKQIPLDRFGKTWEAFANLYGKITSVKTNGLLQLSADGSSCATMLVIDTDKLPQPARRTVVLRRVEGKWFIEDIPELFMAPPQAPPGQAGGQAPQF